MIYWASIGGMSDSEIQKKNLEFAAQKLVSCELRGEFFVYVIPANEIFHMCKPGSIYMESSPTTAHTFAGKVSLLMEEQVLASPYGYVLRVMPAIDGKLILPIIKNIANGDYRGHTLLDSSFQFSSTSIINDCAKFIEAQEDEELRHIRLRHVFSATRFSLSYIAYYLLGEDHGIEFNDNGDEVIVDMPSSLRSMHAGRMVHHLAQTCLMAGEQQLETVKCQIVKSMLE